jgi:hypothetical protein
VPVSTSLEFYPRHSLAVPSPRVSRFQKRFQFRREKIARDFGCLGTPKEKKSIVRSQAGGYAGILDATGSVEGAVGWPRAAYFSRIKRKPFGSMGFVK